MFVGIRRYLKAAALAHRRRRVRCDPSAEARRSFIDYSASRVGQTWTEEDHSALLRHLARVDELCIAIWQKLAARLESQH
jgi:hypothetical protein